MHFFLKFDEIFKKLQTLQPSKNAPYCSYLDDMYVHINFWLHYYNHFLHSLTQTTFNTELALLQSTALNIYTKSTTIEKHEFKQVDVLISKNQALQILYYVYNHYL